MRKNKKSLRYSYGNKDANSAKFFNKNFNKTESYCSNFNSVIFSNTSLVGAKFKFCNLNDVRFENCLIQGALFRKCHFKRVIFLNCIVVSAQFDRTSLVSSTFDNCRILYTNIENCGSLNNTQTYEAYPSENAFNPELLEQVKALRSNEFIRKSSVLHRKKDKINTLTIDILLEEFDDPFLLANLSSLHSLKKEFHTLSYITALLRKI